MSDELKPINVAVMWLLAGRGGIAFLKDLGVEVEYKYRAPLMAKGFLSESKKGSRKQLTLSDSGWYYLSTHMDEPVRNGSAAITGAAMQNILVALGRLMSGRGIQLHTIFAPAAEPETSPPPMEDVSADALDAMWNRLRGIWDSLEDDDESIGLDKVRAAFPEMPRAVFDKNLLMLQRTRRIVINPHEDPARITPELREAALRVGKKDMHFIYKK